MKNIYKGPRQFNESSNNLVIFRFSFFTLTIQLSLLYRENIILSRCYIRDRDITSTVFIISHSL